MIEGSIVGEHVHKDVLPAITERRSIREFDPDYVLTDEELALIVEAGSLSPSGSNTQPWRFIAVRNRQRIRQLLDASFCQHESDDASCIVVCVADVKASQDVDYGLNTMIQDGVFTPERIEQFKNDGVGSKKYRNSNYAKRDVAIAVYAMMLQARHMSIGSCWISVHPEMHNLVRVCCGIPDERLDWGNALRYEVVTLLALGKPRDGQWPEPRSRRALNEIACNDVWDAGLSI